MSTYHRYECKIYDFLIASGMSIICFMAYRTITQKPLQFFLENKDKFQDHDEVAGSKGTKVKTIVTERFFNCSAKDYSATALRHLNRNVGSRTFAKIISDKAKFFFEYFSAKI